MRASFQRTTPILPTQKQKSMIYCQQLECAPDFSSCVKEITLRLRSGLSHQERVAHRKAMRRTSLKKKFFEREMPRCSPPEGPSLALARSDSETRRARRGGR